MTQFEMVLYFFCTYFVLGLIYVEYNMRKIDRYVELYEKDPSKLDREKLERLERMKNVLKQLPSDDKFRKRVLALIKIILILIWLPIAVNSVIVKLKKLLNSGKEKKNEPSGNLE